MALAADTRYKAWLSSEVGGFEGSSSSKATAEGKSWVAIAIKVGTIA